MRPICRNILESRDKSHEKIEMPLNEDNDGFRDFESDLDYD